MSESENNGYQIRLSHEEGFRFRVELDKPEGFTFEIDEPPPLGMDAGPSPGRLLASAVGGCLCASLLFCLNKQRVAVQGLGAEVTAQVERDERGRLRVTKIRACITGRIEEQDIKKVERCVQVFKDYCTVSASVAKGIGIEASVDISAE